MNSIFRFCLLILLLLGGIHSSSAAPQKRTFTIVIDPGHGGKDEGCKGRVLKEKDLNLNIALAVGRLIERNCDDVKVIYTRKTDVFITLMDRTQKANDAKADLFLSIHADAVPKKGNSESVSGAGTFTLGTARNQENLDVAMRENQVILLEDNYQSRYAGFNPRDPESYIIFEMMQNTHQAQSIEFAKNIQQELVTRAKRKNRDVRQAGFYVLRTAAMPSVLVETGFLSNTKEEKWLATSSGQNAIANAIYQGFKDYKMAFDKRNQAQLAQTGHNSNSHSGAVSKPQPSAGKPQATTKPQGNSSKPQANNSKPQNNKPQANNSKPQVNNSKPQANANHGKIYYKIQFLSSPTIQKKGSKALKGIWPVDYYIEGKTYRYTVGKATSTAQLQTKLKEIRKKFPDAFIAKFNANDQRIR